MLTCASEKWPKSCLSLFSSSWHAISAGSLALWQWPEQPLCRSCGPAAAEAAASLPAAAQGWSLCTRACLPSAPLRFCPQGHLCPIRYNTHTHTSPHAAWVDLGPCNVSHCLTCFWVVSCNCWVNVPCNLSTVLGAVEGAFEGLMLCSQLLDYRYMQPQSEVICWWLDCRAPVGISMWHAQSAAAS